MTDTFGLDAPRVTQAQAAELFKHHAELAAMYYEACDDKKTIELLHESITPVRIFFDMLQLYYKEMED